VFWSLDAPFRRQHRLILISFGQGEVEKSRIQPENNAKMDMVNKYRQHPEHDYA
jgi:hypothetical protein